MFIGGEGDTTLSRVRKPIFPVTAVDFRTGALLLDGHMRVVPFKGPKDSTSQRRAVNPGVSGGGLEVIPLPVSVTELLAPTPGG